MDSKKLLTKGWYSVTITQSYIKERNNVKWLYICLTVDSGEYAYQHIIIRYPVNEWGVEQVSKLFIDGGFYVYPDWEQKLFTEQFIKQRFRAHVDRHRDGDIITNFILELKRVKGKPDYDVTRPKTEEFYHKNNKGRELCINDLGTTKLKQFDN